MSNGKIKSKKHLGVDHLVISLPSVFYQGTILQIWGINEKMHSSETNGPCEQRQINLLKTLEDLGKPFVILYQTNAYKPLF